MKTRYTWLAMLLPAFLNAQTVLFSEDFDAGAPGFTLNTSDLGSTTSGSNTWVVNNAFTGGSGNIICFGIPFGFTIPNTPLQPAGIVPQNGNYMHISSVAALNSGVLNASFAAADGLCTPAENNFVRMTSDVSTVGASSVTISFWWLCQGGPQSYGEVYFSNDQGGTWNLITTPITQYRNQPTWAQQTITLPIFNNQPTLRFGFRFVNGTSLLGAEDPAFSVDNFSISSDEGVPNSIAVASVSATSICQGGTLDVAYDALGSYTPGNVFTAQLSDANGSFASPVSVGSVTSTTSGTITATIPAGTPAGSGYRVRVVASTPPTTGSALEIDINVIAAANSGEDTETTICKATGVYDLFALIPGNPDPGGAWVGPGGMAFDGLFNSFSNPGGDYIYAINSPPPCGASLTTVTVELLDGANAGGDNSATSCSTSPQVNLFNFLTGSADLSGIWFTEQGVPTPPTVTSSGAYMYVVYGSGPCPNDTSYITFTVVEAPDAGNGATVTLSPDDPPVSLTSLLNGDPDLGGTWTGPGGTTVPEVLDPATATPGLYVYTVPGTPPCGDATASLAIIITVSVQDIEGGGTPRWLGEEPGSGHVLWFPPHLDGKPVTITVWDAGGRLLQGLGGAVVAQERLLLPLGNASRGMYLVRVEWDGQASILKLVQ